MKKYVISSELDLISISIHKFTHLAATLNHKSVTIIQIYHYIDEHQLQYTVNPNPLAMIFN